MTDENIAAIRARLKFDNIDDFIEGYSRYISSGGIFIPMAANRLKPRGTTIRFQFLLGDGSTALLGEGKVHQIHEPNADNPSSPVGLLVKFTKLSQSSKRIVDQIVEAKSHASDDQPQDTVHVEQDAPNELAHDPIAASPQEEPVVTAPTASAPSQGAEELAAQALMGDHELPNHDDVDDESSHEARDADDDLFAQSSGEEEPSPVEEPSDTATAEEALFEPPPLQTSDTPDPLPSALLPTHDAHEPSNAFTPIDPDVHSEPTVAHDLSEDSSPSRTPTIEAPVDPFSDFTASASESADDLRPDQPLLRDESPTFDDATPAVEEPAPPAFEEPARPETTLSPFAANPLQKPAVAKEEPAFTLAPEPSQPQNPFNTAINPFARLAKKEDEFDLGFDDPSEATPAQPFDLGLDDQASIPGAPLNPFASRSASGVSQNPFLTARARLKSIQTSDEEPAALTEESSVDLSDFEGAPLADDAEQRDDLFLSSFGQPAQAPPVADASRDDSATESEQEAPEASSDFRDFLSPPPSRDVSDEPASDELEDFFADSSVAEDVPTSAPLDPHERLRGELFPDEDALAEPEASAPEGDADAVEPTEDHSSLAEDLFGGDKDAEVDSLADTGEPSNEPRPDTSEDHHLDLGGQLFDDSDIATEGDASLDDDLFFSSSDEGDVGVDALDLDLDPGISDDVLETNSTDRDDAQEPQVEEQDELAEDEIVPEEPAAAPNPFANPLSNITPPAKANDADSALDAGAPPSSFQTSKPLPPLGPRTLAKTEGGLQILAYDDSTIMEDSEGLDALSIADDEADIDMMFDGIFGGGSSSSDGGLFGGGLFDAPASKPTSSSEHEGEDEDELLLEDDTDDAPTAHSPSALDKLEADEAPSQELASLLDQLNDDDDAPLHPSVEELHLSGPSIAEEEPGETQTTPSEEDESLDALLQHAQKDIEAQKEAALSSKPNEDLLDDLLGEDASIQPGADASVEGNFMPMPEPNKKEKSKGFFSKLFGRDD